MECPACKNEMEFEESVHSNYESQRAKVGEHTGDVYKCKECELIYLDNFLSGKLELFSYE
jgi:hypothetical protein